MLQTASQTRSDTHGKFIWCELMTSDTKAAGDFYSAVIGWKVNEMSMPDMPSYFLFEMGEGDNCPGIGGMMDFPPELEGKLPPNWTGYVAVDDVDQTAKDYVALGGRVQREPEDIPGIGRFAVVADPHGAVLCIMKPIRPKTRRANSARTMSAMSAGANSMPTMSTRPSIFTPTSSDGRRTMTSTLARWGLTASLPKAAGERSAA